MGPSLKIVLPTADEVYLPDGPIEIILIWEAKGLARKPLLA